MNMIYILTYAQVAPPGQEITTRPFQLVCGKSWTGTAFGGTRGRSQLPKFVTSYMEKRAPFVDEFISFTMPHTDVNKAFHVMHEGKSLRTVITFPHKDDAEVAAHRLSMSNQQKSAIVFMHGLDDAPASWQESIDWLAGKFPNCKAICPAAPSVPITKNNGEKMTAWCDVYEAWPLTVSSRDDEKGLLSSVESVHQIINKLVSDGVPSNRIILGGFSQGAAIATLATYSYPQTLGGCVNLSGWLPLRDSWSKLHLAANKSTPCFWGHGSADDVISFELQKVGCELLEKAGVPVTACQFDFAHTTSEEEFDGFLTFLRRNFA